MCRWVFAFLLLLGFLFLPPADATSGDKKWAPITIEYHGQSFFILTTSKDTRIAFDPHVIPQYERCSESIPKVDAICMSHNHNDHTRVDAFEDYQKIKVIRGLKSASLKADWAVVDETIKDVKIRTVGVYHDDQEGLLRGKNAVFIVEVDGWKIAHLGDLGHILTPAQVKRIGKVDVIMIPVGGIYTLNGSEAKKVVEQLKPKEYIFPMHFGTKFFEDILSPDEFYEDVEKRRIAISDDNTLTLNRDPDRPRPLIVQLSHEPKQVKKKK